MALRDLDERCLGTLSPGQRSRGSARFANLRDDQQFTRAAGCDGLLHDQPEGGRVLRLKLGLHKPFEAMPGDELPVLRKPCHHEGEQPRVVGARPGRVEKEAFEVGSPAARLTVEEHSKPGPVSLDASIPGPEFPGAGV